MVEAFDLLSKHRAACPERRNTNGDRPYPLAADSLSQRCLPQPQPRLDSPFDILGVANDRFAVNPRLLANTPILQGPSGGQRSRMPRSAAAIVNQNDVGTIVQYVKPERMVNQLRPSSTGAEREHK